MRIRSLENEMGNGISLRHSRCPAGKSAIQDSHSFALEKELGCELHFAVASLVIGCSGRLDEKLESMTTLVGSEFDVPVAFSMSGTLFPVSYPVAHDLLMVAREAVSNAVLHGRPAHVQVSLVYKSRELILSFADDGCGFDTGQLEIQNGHHFGFIGMRERIERWGGSFRLTSAIGAGVRIEVRLARNRRQNLKKPNAAVRKK